MTYAEEMVHDDAIDIDDKSHFVIASPNGTSIDVTLDDMRWHSILTDEVKDKIGAIYSDAMLMADKQLKEINLDSAREVAILLTADHVVASLNSTYRNMKGATDILSFPTDEKMAIESHFLGDLALSYDVMAGQAAEMGISMAEHLYHLLLHGLLHLYGYDHLDETGSTEMEGLEIEILAKHGMENPYGE